MRAGLGRTAIAAAVVIAITATASSVPNVAYARGGHGWHGGGHWSGGGGHWRGGGGHWRGGGWYGGGWGGFGAGLAAGAIVGGLLAAPYYQQPYYYSGPVYYDDPGVDYCLRRFRSYDPYSRTYLGYDGYRHPCP